jgi:integrase
MSELYNIIKTKKPNVKESSITTYISTIRNLYPKVFDDNTFDYMKLVNQSDIVLKYLNTLPTQKRKNTIAALLIISADNKESHAIYLKQLNEDMDDLQSKIDLSKKSEKQEEKWVTQDDIKQVFNKYETIARSIWNLPNIKPSQFLDIQDFVLLSCISGIFIPTRRLEWADMKLRNYKPKEDNYYEEGKFYFNKYKTSKTYGEQVVVAPKPLRNIINKWITLNPHDYMFVNSRFNKISPSSLNKKIDEIFGKKVGINIIRHSNISEKYKNLPALKELKKLSAEMGHSVQEALEYVKH